MSQRVLILGGGYGGLNSALELERRLSDSPRRDWEILLVDRCSYHQHIILTHEVAANSIPPEEAMVPFSRLLRGKTIAFLQGQVDSVDLAQRVASIDGRQIPYHHLVIALGSETDFYGIPGLQENSLTLKSVDDALRINAHTREMFALARKATGEELRAMLTFVVGGGGFTGVELAGEMADWLPELAREQRIAVSEVRLVLVEAAGTILSGFGRRPIRMAREKLQAKGVELKIGTPVARAEPGLVQLGSGEALATHTLIWVGGVKAPPQLAAWGLETGPRGRAVVDEYLESLSHDFVYVVGDCSLVASPSTGRPLPPSAQLALQQAGPVAANVAADLGHGRRRTFEPTPTGDVISLGRGDAIATFGPVVFDGYKARLLKEGIALRYYYRIGGTGTTLRKLPGAVQAASGGLRIWPFR